MTSTSSPFPSFAPSAVARRVARRVTSMLNVRRDGRRWHLVDRPQWSSACPIVRPSACPTVRVSVCPIVRVSDRPTVRASRAVEADDDWRTMIGESRLFNNSTSSHATARAIARDRVEEIALRARARRDRARARGIDLGDATRAPHSTPRVISDPSLLSVNRNQRARWLSLCRRPPSSGAPASVRRATSRTSARRNRPSFAHPPRWAKSRTWASVTS